MRLSEYMEATGVTQAQLAKKAGISRQTLIGVCTGSVPTLRTATRIVKATAGVVSLDDLVDGMRSDMVADEPKAATA